MASSSPRLRLAQARFKPCKDPYDVCSAETLLCVDLRQLSLDRRRALFQQGLGPSGVSSLRASSLTRKGGGQVPRSMTVLPK